MNKEIVPRDKVSVRTEVVMPSESLIMRLVNERIAELMTEAQTADLQPFFEISEVAEAMRRTIHVIERHKWAWLFEEWGCLICERKDARHQSLGMCQRCFSRTRERLNAVKRRHVSDAATQGFRDTVRLAKAALMPSIGKLAAKRGAK
jgi:hypothetical protein